MDVTQEFVARRRGHLRAAWVVLIVLMAIASELDWTNKAGIVEMFEQE